MVDLVRSILYTENPTCLQPYPELARVPVLRKLLPCKYLSEQNEAFMVPVATGSHQTCAAVVLELNILLFPQDNMLRSLPYFLYIPWPTHRLFGVDFHNEHFPFTLSFEHFRTNEELSEKWKRKTNHKTFLLNSSNFGGKNTPDF